MKLLLIKTILIIIAVLSNNKTTIQINENNMKENNIIINDNIDIIGTIKIEKTQLAFEKNSKKTLKLRFWHK